MRTNMNDIDEIVLYLSPEEALVIRDALVRVDRDIREDPESYNAGERAFVIGAITRLDRMLGLGG